MKWKREDLDLTIEKQIVTGFIVSDDFAKKLRPIISYDYFQSEYCKEVAKWCIEYYDIYSKTPQRHIKDIYLTKLSSFPEEHAEMISLFLQGISDEYDREQFDKEKNQYLSDSYIVDKVLLYCRRRSLEIAQQDVSVLLAKNKIDEAESKLITYQKVVQYTNPGYEPLKDKDLLYRALSEEETPLLVLPGNLGKFVGPLHKKFFLAIAGPAKRGKSYFMNEFIIHSVRSGLNVAYFSMGDMTPVQIEKRAMMNITARAKEAGTYIFPCLDCYWNQKNICDKPERTCKVGLLVEGKKPKLGEEDRNYKVCTACTDKYRPSTWIYPRKVKKLDYNYGSKIQDKFARMYHGRFLTYFWPRGVGSISSIRSILDMWETFDKFIPHVIITDYADIMKPDRYHKNDIDNINQIWEAHDALCKERDVLLVTGTHTRRGTFSSDITQEDIASDIRKTHHVNAIISINQTEAERIARVSRIGYLMARDESYSNYEYCVLLQQLDVGQFCIDSYLV